MAQPPANATPSAVDTASDADLLSAYDSPEFDKVADALTPAEAQRLQTLLDARDAKGPVKPKGRFDDLPPEGPGRMVGQAATQLNPLPILRLLSDSAKLMGPPRPGQTPTAATRKEPAKPGTGVFEEQAAAQGRVVDAGKGLYEALLAGPAREAYAAVMPSGQVGPDGKMPDAELTARLRHLISAVPIAGPAAVDTYDMYQEGRPYSAIGNAVGLAGQIAGPKALEAARVRLPMPNLQRALAPEEEAAMKWAADHGIEVPIAQRTGNSFLQRLAARVSQTQFGEKLATEATRKVAGQTQAAGELLRQRVRPGVMSVTNAEAGQQLIDHLEGLKQLENGAPATETQPAVAGRAREHFDTLREMQADPARSEVVVEPLPKYVRERMVKSVGSVPSQAEMLEMRRIAEELKNQRYSGKTYQEAGPGRGGDIEVTRGRVANAGVYNDILDLAPGTAKMTGQEMSDAIDKALNTGVFTNPAHGALEVAKQRIAGKRLPGGGKGYLAPDAGWWAAPKVDMPWPVDLSKARPALRQMLLDVEGGMTAAEKSSSKGLVALRDIVNGPDARPLMEVQRGLSAISDLAGVGKTTIKTASEGMAGQAWKELDAAFQAALKKGGPDAVSALKRGNAAVQRGHLADDLLQKVARPDKFGAEAVREPVQAAEKLITADDRNFKRLELLHSVAPEQIRTAGRAWFDTRLQQATAKGVFDIGEAQQWVKDWRAMGPDTKKLIFQISTKEGPGIVREMDHFFETIERLGSQRAPVIVGQITSSAPATAAATAMTQGVPAGARAGLVQGTKNAVISMSRYPLAKLLYTPGGARILTEGLTIPLGDTAKVAAWNGRVKRALEAAERLPMAADADRSDRAKGP